MMIIPELIIIFLITVLVCAVRVWGIRRWQDWESSKLIISQNCHPQQDQTESEKIIRRIQNQPRSHPLWGERDRKDRLINFHILSLHVYLLYNSEHFQWSFMSYPLNFSLLNNDRLFLRVSLRTCLRSSCFFLTFTVSAASDRLVIIS